MSYCHTRDRLRPSADLARELGWQVGDVIAGEPLTSGELGPMVRIEEILDSGRPHSIAVEVWEQGDLNSDCWELIIGTPGQRLLGLKRRNWTKLEEG